MRKFERSDADSSIVGPEHCTDFTTPFVRVPTTCGYARAKAARQLPGLIANPRLIAAEDAASLILVGSAAYFFEVDHRLDGRVMEGVNAPLPLLLGTK